MECFQIKREGSIAILTFNRPPANALSRAVITELSEALDELETNEEVKVIILHGDGKFFAAGADIKEFTQVENGKEFSELARQGQILFDRLEALTKPVIAAIHGAALGGGLELAMACHLRIAADDAKLGLPELSLGLIPGFAGTQRLPDLVGRAKAAEMLLTGEPITGEEAERWGLVNGACPPDQVLEKAKKLAEKAASKSGVTIKMVMELLQFSKRNEFSDGVQKEAELFGKAYDSHDGKEGIHAFLEKRKPTFKNQ
ncbi:enoyl-CoA hydratase [Alteribacillus sp. JSM 102045]|uniref:enoyl-CoA hydratase n=1 Tax=Alteribacillus sp. JSM 102045 TaxID=1562101 RepID=UPI0035BEDD97